MGDIVVVPEGVEGFLPPRGCDIEALSCAEIQPGDENVDVHASSGLPVQNSGPRGPVRIEARKGKTFEIIEDLLDVPVGRGIVRSPGNDPGGVDARKSEGVCDLGNQERVAPEEPDLFPENSVMIGAPGHIQNGLRSLSLSVCKEFNVHCLLPSERGIPSSPGDLSRREASLRRRIMKKELSQSR